MTEITFKFAWGKSDPAMTRDAQAFWKSLGGVVTTEEITERLPQLCALAYEGDKVAAVSTGFFYDFPRLRSRFVYYRTTVGEGYRRRRLASRLCKFSRL